MEINPLNFEIHMFFANAFESTLPLPKMHDLNSRWLVPGLADVVVPILLRNCKFSSQNLLLFLSNGQCSSEIISRGGTALYFDASSVLFLRKGRGSTRDLFFQAFGPQPAERKN